MPDGSMEIGQVRAWVLDPEGPLLAADRDVADLVGEVLSAQARVVAIPLSRLPPTFLDLKTRAAGELLQKFVTIAARSRSSATSPPRST